MEANPAIVIDSKGYKVEFAYIKKKEDGSIFSLYPLQDGERFILSDIDAALSMVKPCWTGTEWKETATLEEIEAARPPVFVPALDPVTELQLAMAELYEEVFSRG